MKILNKSKISNFFRKKDKNYKSDISYSKDMECELIKYYDYYTPFGCDDIIVKIDFDEEDIKCMYDIASFLNLSNKFNIKMVMNKYKKSSSLRRVFLLLSGSIDSFDKLLSMVASEDGRNENNSFINCIKKNLYDLIPYEFHLCGEIFGNVSEVDEYYIPEEYIAKNFTNIDQLMDIHNSNSEMEQKDIYVVAMEKLDKKEFDGTPLKLYEVLSISNMAVLVPEDIFMSEFNGYPVEAHVIGTKNGEDLVLCKLSVADMISIIMRTQIQSMSDEFIKVINFDYFKLEDENGNLHSLLEPYILKELNIYTSSDQSFDETETLNNDELYADIDEYV